MSKTYVITGEYGSGKTEFSLNLAHTLRQQSFAPIYLADLDVINPYFRSREKRISMQAEGIIIVGSNTAESLGFDLPAISYGFIQEIDEQATVIIDLAGSENGLKPLEPLYQFTTEKKEQPEFLCVFNLFRPLTNTKEKALTFLDRVNTLSPWQITGLVNNCNLLQDTDASHILQGQEILLQIGEERNIPLRFTQLKRNIYQQIHHQIQSEQVILFDRLQMREDWQ